MNKLLNQSLKKFLIYAGIVLACSIPVYYAAISMLWQYELDEHNITLTPEAGREDSFLIIGAVTLLTIVFFVLLLGGFILLNRRISSKLWQPFHRSLEKIKTFDLNKQRTITFEQTDIAEFAELNQSLDKLIAGSVAAYNQQKEFADNASHELQTPLAIVQSKLEMLLQNKSLTGSQYDSIEEALKALSRVNRINKNLLLLTRIDNSQFMDKELINLSDLLNNTLSQFAGFAETKNVLFEPNISSGVVIEGNRTLVEILVNNLLTNAIRHSSKGAIVSLSLTSHRLVLANDGETPLKTGQLFKRFANTSSLSPGTGLGLSLIKQVADRYNWQLNYSFEMGRHTFSVAF